MAGGASLSVCGINCEHCEQFTDRQCAGCTRDKGCLIYACVEEKDVKGCIDCTRAKFCNKRKEAIEKCLVFHPREEFKAGGTYLINDTEDALLTFTRLVFSGREGLLLTGENTAEITSKYMLESAVKIGSLDESKQVIFNFIKNNKNAVVLLDSLEHLIEKNALSRVVDTIAELNEQMVASDASLLLAGGGITKDQREIFRELLANFRIESIIKSISNPKRKDIIDFLRRTGKASFAELYKELKYSVPPKLSFHLKIMRESGVIEQDEEGIYYISELGREIDKMLKKIGGIATRETRPSPKVEARRYEWYMALMKKRGNYSTVEVIEDIKRSLEVIAGKKNANTILQSVLSDYIAAEKDMAKEDQKRTISEIAFVFLVDFVPLVGAIDWADELLVKHGLK
ncbi:MAG: ArsR family transcriptional regulator [Candidatus Hydrothermarchaeaceae archaeon]